MSNRNKLSDYTNHQLVEKQNKDDEKYPGSVDYATMGIRENGKYCCFDCIPID